MIGNGVTLVVLSGLCNGLFTTPMKLERHWKWENIWFGFIIVACLVMPLVIVLPTHSLAPIMQHAPTMAILSALLFGFVWGFGAICFGRSVERLGVSVANTLVIGLSSALGSLGPLMMMREAQLGSKQVTLLFGVLTLLIGVLLCGKAGQIRDGKATPGGARGSSYFFAVAAGVLSGIFNIGYALALPIADTGVELGFSRFTATNCIWVLMLGAGSIPNLVYCGRLMKRNRTAQLLSGPRTLRSWATSTGMGLLWGGSIFLYGAATPLLGNLGPSVGWPLSLAVGLLVANVMGVLLGEWKATAPRALNYMWSAVFVLLCAIVLCGFSARVQA